MPDTFYDHRLRTQSLDAMVERNLPPAPRVANSTQRIVTHHLYKDGQKWYNLTHDRFKTTHADLKAPTGEKEKKISGEHHLLYRDQAWKGNIDRLKAAGIDTSRLVEDAYEFCLPNISHSKAQLRVFDFLFLAPMLKTDQEISSVIKLEPSTVTSPPLPMGEHFYVRTWELQPQELRKVVDIMKGDGKHFPEVTQWEKMLDLFSPKKPTTFDLGQPSSIKNGDHSTLPQSLADESSSRYGDDFSRFAKVKPQIYSIRYIGKVSGPRRPIDRFEADLKQRKSGIMHEFLQVLEEHYPLVFDAGRTSLIKNASLVAEATDDFAAAPGVEMHRYNAPARERFLIQTFGHDTLLNRMYGGWFTDYVPPYEDEENYDNLNVRAYSELLANAGTLDATTFTQLKAHHNEVMGFVGDNAGSTGGCRNQYTIELRDAAFEQSIPYLYRNEYVLFTIIGKDITYFDYKAGKKFFDCGSQAATLARNFIHRNISQESSNPVAFDPRAFPFVNLWRCLWHRDYKEAIRFLQEYLQIVRPLIAITFSTEVNEIVQGDFTHTMDFPDGYISYSAGVPTIQYYDDQDKANSAFMNVPHMHPGRDKYTSQNKPLRRIFDKSYQATLLLGQIAIEVIDEYLDEGYEFPDRQSLCQEILNKYNALAANSEAHKTFFEEFENARLAFSSYRPSGKAVVAKSERGESDNFRLVANANGRMKLMSFGQAEGLPDSRSRDQQLELLWLRDIPVLHTVVKRTSQSKDQWKEQFMSLPTGAYFLLKVFSQMKPAEFMEGILKHIRPDLAGNTDWLTESPARTDAILECGMWLALPKKQDGGELTRMYRHFPLTYSSAFDLHGKPVAVGDTGKIRLHWQKDENTKVLVNLRCSDAIPGVGEGNFLRSVLFTENGIDIIDGDGAAFRKLIRKDVYASASIERQRFLTSVGGQDLLDLWVAARGAHGHKISAASSVAFDQSASTSAPVKNWSNVPKGLELINHAAKSEKPKQNRPPQQGDALYLLDQ